ncbi:hypothetical protein M0D21_18935 [Aquimarina sp. D1M17]|uniref:hypothetical protein n=1 Tax=Aquimarina acroporae TaxID=2937283 RepID=UPI0020BDD486|nr:hypothetical protein [Aquimarina acroporae]MCK8523667.1 hypothetical protein [Aquimarina acroporae]
MKTQKFKHFALVCVTVLMASCSKTDLADADETQALEQKEKVELVETPDDKNFVAIGLAPGIYGNSNVDAWDSETYSYILTQAELNAVPSHLRRFRVKFDKWVGAWANQATYNNQPSTVTAKFPSGNTSVSLYRIGFQMYNKNTGQNYAQVWKMVQVNN